VQLELFAGEQVCLDGEHAACLEGTSRCASTTGQDIYFFLEGALEAAAAQISRERSATSPMKWWRRPVELVAGQLPSGGGVGGGVGGRGGSSSPEFGMIFFQADPVVVVCWGLGRS